MRAKRAENIGHGWGLGGGGKKNKSWIFNLHASCPHSPCSPDSKNIRMSSELNWEVLPLDGHFGALDEPKIQRK